MSTRVIGLAGWSGSGKTTLISKVIPALVGRGLKCPLPVLRTRKALAGMRVGDILVVACTDPLAAVDIPALLAQTGDVLEAERSEAGAVTFRIRKS